MSGADIFVDTNICIYLMNGDAVLAEMLEGQNLFISIITEMELHAYHGNNSAALQILKEFLQAVSVINIDEKVKLKTISIRKATKLKLPDSIISASALAYQLALISADNAFKKVEELDLILYENI